MSNPSFTHKDNILLQPLHLDIKFSKKFALVLAAIYLLAINNLYWVPSSEILNKWIKASILSVITTYTGWVIYRHLLLKNHPLQGCSLQNDGNFVRDHRIIATLIEEFSKVYTGFIILHAKLQDKHLPPFLGNKATLIIFPDAINNDTYRRLKIYFHFRRK